MSFGIVPDEFRQGTNLAALKNPDLFIEFEALLIVEDRKRRLIVFGSDHTFAERGHDLFGSFGVHFDVERDHASERRARIAVACFDINLLHRLAGTGDRRAAGIHMLHDGACRFAEIFYDVQCAGNIFKIGLGESVLSAFERLHSHDRAIRVRGSIKRGGLMGIGAVTQSTISHICVRRP